MIVETIRVRNFRSIKDETLVCQQLTALVGPNGSGKSSFLRALEMFYTPSARCTQHDFHAEKTSDPILITVTYGDLTNEERKLFDMHVDGDHLTVEKEIRWPYSRESQKYFGTKLQNADFDTFRQAQSAKDRKAVYDSLIASGSYPDLPKWTKQDDAAAELAKWEQRNPQNCQRQRDEFQFFGYKEVGGARLERFTLFRLIPAVRDAAQDASEGRGSLISDMMDLVVRKVLAQSDKVAKLRQETQAQYEEIVDPTKLPELQGLAADLTSTLRTYVGDAAVELRWLPLDVVELPEPKADIRLVEDGYATTVERSGHGLQRAFIVTMLQHLAVAQQQTTAEASDDEEPVEGQGRTNMPSLILAIEEPELYQHPNRQRHLSRILARLASGKIAGVAERTQVIYTTHSPLFVDVDRTDQIRALRKLPVDRDSPKQTKVFWTTLDDVARIIEKAEGAAEGSYSAVTTRPRLLTLMTPWMNEGFFADVVVLVEGEEDRAAILGSAYAADKDLEAMGVSVIPCMGKTNLHKATAVFTSLAKPVYAIWDSDFGKSRNNKEEATEKKRNHCLLRLFHQAPQDWPDAVSANFACFQKDLTSTLRNEITEDLYVTALADSCERLSLDADNALKNPAVVQEILAYAATMGRSCATLPHIVDRIVALAESQAS